MIYPRVNLLKKSERRYQGAVSQRFLLGGIIIVPALFIILFGAIQFLQYGNLKSDLQFSREILKELEPKLALHRGKESGLAANRKLLELLDGWEKSQASFSTLMEDVQDTVPVNIQFTRLSVRSDFKSSVYETAANLEPTYNLVIEGMSQGDEAVNEVTHLRKNLMNCAKVATVFDSVKLVSMRKLGGEAGEDKREFRLEGEAAEGDGR